MAYKFHELSKYHSSFAPINPKADWLLKKIRAECELIGSMLLNIVDECTRVFLVNGHSVCNAFCIHPVRTGHCPAPEPMPDGNTNLSSLVGIHHSLLAWFKGCLNGKLGS